MTALTFQRTGPYDEVTAVDDDGCESGNHWRDELCARTAVKSPPPVDLFTGVPDAIRALSDEWLPNIQAFNESVRAPKVEDERGGST